MPTFCVSFRSTYTHTTTKRFWASNEASAKQLAGEMATDAVDTGEVPGIAADPELTEAEIESCSVSGLAVAPEVAAAAAGAR